MSEKKLCKVNEGKMICGVCAGIAEYFSVDPTLIRLAWVLFCFIGAGFIAYFIAAIIMPTRTYIE